jgi:nicotinate-nucleotide pyrophosphorylase (carboxylating)
MAKDFKQIAWDARVEDDCRHLVRLAVREDLERTYDWTTVALVGHEAVGAADVVARRAGVVAGLPAARVVLEEMAPGVHWKPLVEDGAAVEAGTAVARMEGPARDLLTCERIVLNFLGRLSGVATLARQYVEQIAGTNAHIYDTRKTTPGWRRLEKYAVHCGGGRNHRAGLFDAVLIKDNHLALGGAQNQYTPAEAVARARAHVRETLSREAAAAMVVEIEVDTLDQLREVLPAAPDIALLDNMTNDQLREAVALRDALAPQVELEASGGVNLQTVAGIAATGVERVSVGALTHAAASLDVGLDWR